MPEAGRIIGGGRRAFQKYESGATPPSEAAIGLVELLDQHPEEVEMLRGLLAQASPPSSRPAAAKPDLKTGGVRKRGLAA